MQAEIRKRLVADFASAVVAELPAFGRVLPKRVQGAPTYQSSVDWAEGRLSVRLSFLATNRFGVELIFASKASSTSPVLVQSYASPPSRERLSGGYWIHASSLPCLEDTPDDFWAPTRPPAEMILRHLRSAIRSEGRAAANRWLGLLYDDEAAMARVSGGDTTPKDLLDPIESYFELERDPWNLINKWRGLDPADIDFAVGGKIENVISHLASSGIAEFKELLLSFPSSEAGEA